MLQIKNRIPGLLACIVSRRSVDECAAELVGALRPEQNFFYPSVGNIPLGIEGLVVSGNLDTALPTGRTVVVESSGIIEGTAVDSQVIVVESFVSRSLAGASPVAVSVFVEDGAAGDD